jgi:hypothetical protein
MNKLLTAFVSAVWILSIFICASCSQDHFLPIEVVKVKDINKTFQAGEYGAIEMSRLEVSEASDDPIAGYAGLLRQKSLPSRAYGCVSPMGWKAYVSQDAVSSWKGSGLAAYALWS